MKIYELRAYDENFYIELPVISDTLVNASEIIKNIFHDKFPYSTGIKVALTESKINKQHIMEIMQVIAQGGYENE